MEKVYPKHKSRKKIDNRKVAKNPHDEELPDRLNRVGKKKFHPDMEMLERAFKSMLPIDTIAYLFDCNPDTLYANYPELVQKCRAERRLELLMTMWDKAINGKDTTMLIWLSKQYLSHKDRQPEDVPIVNFNVKVNELPTEPFSDPKITLEAKCD